PLGKITSVAVDTAGNVYAADISNRRVVSIAPSGALVTVLNLPDPGVQGTDRLAIDAAGNLYLLETGTVNTPARIIKRDAGGGLTTIVDGGGLSNSSSDLAVDPQGNNIYVADSGNNSIRRIGSDGVIVTVAGIGSCGVGGDGGPALLAQICGYRSGV